MWKIEWFYYLCPLPKKGSQGSADGQFNHIVGIAIDSQDHVYVMDLGNGRMLKFDS